MDTHQVIYEVMTCVEFSVQVCLAELMLDGKMGFVSMPIMLTELKMLTAQQADTSSSIFKVEGITPVAERTARPSAFVTLHCTFIEHRARDTRL